jgi:ketosteroid isomerase-like protein
MDELTDEAVQQIERIHSRWIELEIAGENHKIMTLCGDDIELWPPDAQPVLGRTAVSALMAHTTAKIHSIEIANRRIRGSSEIAYLTANYKTMSVTAEDTQPRQTYGSHLWILERRAGTWPVTLVSWTSWVRGAESKR